VEEVALTKDDVLFHLRTDDTPYMIISEAGSWTHLNGCVLAYVLQRRDIFQACLESYLKDLSKERRDLFMPVLKDHGIHPSQILSSTKTS
jgi:hypothetical protein